MEEVPLTFLIGLYLLCPKGMCSVDSLFTLGLHRYHLLDHMTSCLSEDTGLMGTSITTLFKFILHDQRK